MTPPIPNSYWLIDDLIVCGEYPRDIDDFSDQAAMSNILAAGVRVFVDLTEPDELKPYREIALGEAAKLKIDPDDLEFHKHPIRDVSVPKSAGDMRETIRTIRSAIHRKKIVYLHCWGGRGRTGTVAGCLLHEISGLFSDQCLKELKHRWSFCAKSEFSDSPETVEQSSYVLNWPEETPSLSIPERVRFGILGAAVADAVGVPVEFQSRAARKADPVTTMREFGTHQQPKGTWSDDSSMIFATMTGVINENGFSPESIMAEFLAWKNAERHTPHGVVFDIGNATRDAINRFAGGERPTECGKDDNWWGGTDEYSNGNGALMRILPIALAWPNDPRLMERTSTVSALTHAHERSRFCCAFYCLVASDVIHGSSLEEAIQFAWDIMDST